MATTFNYSHLNCQSWFWQPDTDKNDICVDATELTNRQPTAHHRLVISDSTCRSERTLTQNKLLEIFTLLREHPIPHIKELVLCNMHIDDDTAMVLANMVLSSPDLESISLDFAHEKPTLGQATLLLMLRRGKKLGAPLRHVHVQLPFSDNDKTNHVNDRQFVVETSLEAIEWIRSGTAPEWFSVSIPDTQADNLVEALAAARGAGVHHLDPSHAYSDQCRLCGKRHRLARDALFNVVPCPAWCRAHALLTIAALSQMQPAN